jgi:AcrR family transcriptional regulator
MPQSTALPAPTRRQGASVNLAEPRAARTHEALTTALFELLREHDLTEISISELCRTAGVHRTTFYGHYGDIYAFASDAFARILDDLSEISGPPTPEGEADPGSVQGSLVSSIRHDLEFVRDNRPAFRMIFGTQVDPGFRKFLFQRSYERASEVIGIWQRHGVGLDIHVPTAAAWIAGGSIGVLEEWAVSNETDVDARAANTIANWPSWMLTTA